MKFMFALNLLACVAFSSAFDISATSHESSGAKGVEAQLAKLSESHAKLSESHAKLSETNVKLSTHLKRIYPSACSGVRAARDVTEAFQACPFLGENYDAGAVNKESVNGTIVPVGCSLDAGSNTPCYAKYENTKCTSDPDQSMLATKGEAKKACSASATCQGIHQVGPSDTTNWAKWLFCKDARKDWTQSTGAIVFARQGPLNIAKCAGPEQDHRQLTGAMDCRNVESENDDSTNSYRWNKPGNCPDNLSNGKAITFDLQGRIHCAGLSGDKSNKVFTPNPNLPLFINANWPERQVAAATGLSTKIVATHGNAMSKYAGVIALKRIRCLETQGVNRCTVFKTGYCIRRPTSEGEFFPAERTIPSTKEQDSAFATWVAANAFNNKRKHWATLKPEYKCFDSDQAIADAWLRML